jgi:hypothetical protein
MQNEYRAAFTKEPVEAISGVRNHRFLTVIKALLWGTEVRIDGQLVRLAETENGGVTPIVVCDEDEGLIWGTDGNGFEWISEQVGQMSEKDFQKISIDYTASIAISDSQAKREIEEENTGPRM